MPKTVTIEVPDKLIPQLDRVIAHWAKRGKTADVTLGHVLRHGLDMMDIAEEPEPGTPIPAKAWDPDRDAPGEEIPF